MPYKIPFRVFHATTEDESFPAVELNRHSPATRGWISSRFCTYPQRVILVMNQRARLCKIQVLSHQYLIASKLEFFVGDTSEGNKNQILNARYSRLGYVSLSDNETTKFKARELRSVCVDAVGSCVQLVLHKNHTNKYNMYNQVGLVAVNLIGDAITESGSNVLLQKNVSSQRPDFIPPTEDLAFDIYQDPEIANIIRRLEKQKLAVVTDERFDEAQKLRNTIGYLQHIGERLGRLALEKQHAVEEENYERAKLKKYQIDEIRANLYRDPDMTRFLAIHLDGQSGEVVPSNCDRKAVAVNGTASDSRETVMHRFGDGHVSVTDDRPLPALQHRPQNNNALFHVSLNQASPESGQDCGSVGRPDDASCAIPGSPVPQMSPIAERLANRDADADETSHLSDLPSTPESLSETHRRLAAVAIDVVGLPLVTKLFSKSWVFRQHALMDLETRVCSTDLAPPVCAPDSTGADPQAELRSTVFLLQKALHDPVLSVFRLATELIKNTVVDFAERHAIARTELHHGLDKLIPVLFHRTGDPSVRIRDVAKSQILLMAQWPQMRQCLTFWNEVVRPFSPVTLDRLALSQLEIVTELYASLGVDSSDHGLTLELLVSFTTKALNHRSNEVRDAAENLMVALYRAENRALIRRALPPNNVNAQRHPLFRRLFAKFDRIDEKYAPVEVQHDNALPDMVKKQKQMDALQADVQHLRSVANQERRRSSVATVTPRRHSSAGRGSKRTPNPGRPSVPGKSVSSKSNLKAGHVGENTRRRGTRDPTTPPPVSSVAHRQSPLTQTAGDPELLLNLDKTCIFCGERNEEFTEDGLDLHYWKDCPMLQQCLNCKQVVEVAGLFEHLLSECETAAVVPYVRCNRCTEVVPRPELESHPCQPSTCTGLRCPLCHTDLPLVDADSGTASSSVPEEVWKAHLIGGLDRVSVPVCSSNPRRPVRMQHAVHLGSEHHLPRSSSQGAQSRDEPKVDSKQPAPTPHQSLIPRPTQSSLVRPARVCYPAAASSDSG